MQRHPSSFSMSQTKQSNPPKWPLLASFFIIILAEQISTTPRQQWLVTYQCNASEKPSQESLWDYCRQSHQNQARVSSWDLSFSLAFHIASILAAPVFAALSNSIGRRPILLLTLISFLLKNLGVFIVSKFNTSLWVLFGFYLVAGLLGGIGGSLSVVQAYLTDGSDFNRLDSLFIHLESATMLSHLMGPLLGGALSRLYGVSIAFKTSAGLFLVGYSAVAIFVKESIHKFADFPPSLLSCITSSFTSMAQTLKRIRLVDKWILLTILLGSGIANGAKTIFTMWTAYKFGWDAFSMGTFSFLRSAANVVVMYLLLPLQP